MKSLDEITRLIGRNMGAVTEPSRVAGATITTISYGPRQSVSVGTVSRVKETTYAGFRVIMWEVRERGPAGRRTEYTLFLESAVLSGSSHAAGTFYAAGEVMMRSVQGRHRGGSSRSTYVVLADNAPVSLPWLTL